MTICEKTNLIICAAYMMIDLMRRGKLYLRNPERLPQTVLLKLSLLTMITKPNFGRAEVVQFSVKLLTVPAVSAVSTVPTVSTISAVPAGPAEPAGSAVILVVSLALVSMLIFLWSFCYVLVVMCSVSWKVVLISLVNLFFSFQMLDLKNSSSAL